MIRATFFPPLPDLAAIPLGALSLDETYVARSSLLERTIFCLTNPDSAKAPCVLVGMGGGGKTVLASAVVRNENVRQHFRGSIFWLSARFGGKDHLHELLQPLVLQVGVTATDYHRRMPTELNSLEDVTCHLTAVGATGASPRLVVLDDVWEREVVDALRHTGLQLLLTTRDRSVVSISDWFVEVENLGQDEALELLRAGCGASAALALPQQEALQVADDCGMLELSLSLAAPLLKGPPQHPNSWRTLHDALAKGLGTYRTMTVEARMHCVLDVSFGAMADDPRKQERCMFLSVLAQGTLAYSDMLEDLWDEARGSTHTFAKQLVHQSMLQSTGDAYRVHDLVLRFLKPKLEADCKRRSIATSRIAEHLGKLNVLHRYSGSGETMGGLYSLIALWRSVESLSEKQQVAAVYERSLSGVTESGPWSEAGRVLELMGRYAEADPWYQRALAINEKVLGPYHPLVATVLSNRALLLSEQGKYSEAEPLYRRTQEILETSLGRDHPHVATILSNRAELLSAQGKHGEAIPLMERAAAIWMEKLGEGHPETVRTQKRLEDERNKQSGTIKTSEHGHCIKTMKFSVSPVVRVAVGPKIQSDLPKLVEALKLLSKTDPMVQCYTRESGEHIIAGCGELHLEICLKDLQEDYMGGRQVEISKPVVSYHETVTAESSQLCLAKSPNKKNRLWMVATPLESGIAEDVDDGRLDARDDAKSRARYLADKYGWDATEAHKIWAFGPAEQQTNILVDMTKGAVGLNEIRYSVIGGFGWATNDGPLMEEKVRGCRFNVIEAKVHSSPAERGNGQIIPMARRVVNAAILTASPAVLEPVYLCEISCPQDALGGVYGVLTRRRGRVFEKEQRPGTPMMLLKAYLPIVESFGFDADLRSHTGGKAFPQCAFDHWQPVGGDHLEEGSKAWELVRAVRQRKSLSEKVPSLDRFLDQLWWSTNPRDLSLIC